jgi:hypothetical protein
VVRRGLGLTLVLIPFGNRENTTALLDVPFGLALVLAGALLLHSPGHATQGPDPRQQVHVQAT